MPVFNMQSEANDKSVQKLFCINLLTDTKQLVNRKNQWKNWLESGMVCLFNFLLDTVTIYRNNPLQ